MKRWNQVIVVGLVFLFGWVSVGLGQQQALSIRDCIQIALKNNPDLRNAERQTRMAGTNVTMARSTILPNVNLSFMGSRTYTAQQGPYLQDVPIFDPDTKEVIGIRQQSIFRASSYRNFYNNGLNITQMLFDGGRWWNQIKQSNAGYRSAEANYLATRENTIALVTQRYYTLLKSLKLLEVYEKAVESAKEQLKKTESMYEVGAVAQADVFRARVSLGEQQINLIQQRNAVENNRSSLNVALGWAPKRKIEIMDEELPIEPLNISLEELWKVAEERNPELRSLAETVRSDEYGIKSAKASFLPQVSFSASYSRNHTNIDLLYDPFDKNYSWSGRLNLSWNLFNGFSDAAQVERASLTYYMDKERMISRRLSLKSEIEQAYLNLKAYEEISKINEINLKSAEEDLRLNEERYRIGSGTILEVIDAQVNLIRARSTMISTKYDYLTELVNLYSKIGILEEKLKLVIK